VELQLVGEHKEDTEPEYDGLTLRGSDDGLVSPGHNNDIAPAMVLHKVHISHEEQPDGIPMTSSDSEDK
jgi:hypothetical protein